MMLGDFNFIRGPDSRNMQGGDHTSMMMFNSIIINHDLVDIPLKGRAFTWSNMQDSPLLEKLDWIFTSPRWTTDYPNTMAFPLAKICSDHVPIKVQIDSKIPKSNIFRFEEFWTDFDGFIETVEKHWNNTTYFGDSAKNIVAKFKALRKGLKSWSKKFSQLNRTIDNCCFYVKLLDGIEEQRALSIIERNFRKALIKHTNSLLEAKRKYWRIRANIRWAKLGNENTKLFHAIATYAFRHNYISFLLSNDNIIVHEHNQKAAILWQSFKERIGMTDNTTKLFGIDHLALDNSNEHLEIAFSKEEIDEVIKTMSNEKSPGPDGFIGYFMKSCWDIIKDNIYKLIKDFYEENVSLKPVNTAYITLIPKKDNPETPIDFRPISLVSMPNKIITKLLAKRAQQEILSMINKNQYGFIKTRTIQDYLAWSFEYLHMCHKSKNPIIIFKIDFEKSFDKVDHNAIFYMLKHLGFGDNWIRWIKMTLSTATASVILNGVPGKTIICKRGVRQGDPLSPLLYVIVAEVLQRLINESWLHGDLNLPVQNPYTKNYPIIQYADDTLIILPVEEGQLYTLMNILNTFTEFTGLKVNYSKSSLVPININDERALQLANILGCKKESMPFTYLGLPMGTTRPKVDDLIPVVSGLDKRLSGVATMMTYSGRLTHWKAMISALPIFSMCCIRVPFTILDHFGKSGRGFIWYGNKINKQRNCLVKWDTVCLPKKAGGLGVLDLRMQNRALMTKFLYKFFNRLDIPWVELIWDVYYRDGIVPSFPTKVGSFWWRDCCAILQNFKSMTVCNPKAGGTVKLWQDRWHDDSMQNMFPQLYSYAKNTECIIASASTSIQNDFYEMFHLPMSSIAVQQSHCLLNLIIVLNIDSNNKDSWNFLW